MKEKLKRYIDSYMNRRKAIFQKCATVGSMPNYDYSYAEASSISEYIDNNKNENKFQKLLFNHIDRKNLTDSEVYNKVNIDRRLFSKIRSDNNYHPSKETVILLAISLELNEDELEDLLLSASYSLPKNNYYDLIIRFCFKERIFNIFSINEYLEEYKCKLLPC